MDSIRERTPHSELKEPLLRNDDDNDGDGNGDSDDNEEASEEKEDEIIQFRSNVVGVVFVILVLIFLIFGCSDHTQTGRLHLLGPQISARGGTIETSAAPHAIRRRRLLLEMETGTVHHKDETTTTTAAAASSSSSSAAATTTKASTMDTNPNIEEPNDGYKPTYHYTNPHPISNSFGKNNNDNQDDEPQAPSFFLRDSTTLNDAETFNPQIAWLASFPNSGTSFTMGLVARATNTTFATNYGIEANFGSRTVPSLPIYDRHPEGPFMPDPVTSYHHRQLPYGKYVMTKTHCGGYCFNCAPRTYAYGYSGEEEESPDTDTASPNALPPGLAFLGDCASGQAVDDRGNLVDVSYPPERVARVIHLVRNPMHNMIARFHLERKHHGDANTTADRVWLDEHPDNQEGMSQFCREQNDRRWEDETNFLESSFFRLPPADDDGKPRTSFARRNGGSESPTEARFPQDFEAWKELVAKVPCRGDLFRYVQWHNLLHQSLDYMPYKLPVLTLYYEGYESPTYQATADSILDFLELQAVPGDDRGNVKWNEFHSRSDYDDFFSHDQKDAIREFLHTLSSFRVWGELEHYFR